MAGKVSRFGCFWRRFDLGVGVSFGCALDEMKFSC